MKICENLEKSLRFCKSLQKSGNFAFGEVRKNAHFVDLEKILKNEYLVAKIGLDTAENEPQKGKNYLRE